MAKTSLRNTAQKIKFSIKDFFSKCVQIRSFLRIWSHLLKKSLIDNFIFCAVKGLTVALVTFDREILNFVKLLEKMV